MPDQNELRLGTRGSQLALWQANARRRAHRRRAAARRCRIVVIKTSGDRLQDAPLSEVGGKRLFVKEIEDALLSAARSILPCTAARTCRPFCRTGSPSAAVLPREDPRDAVVLPVRLKPDTTPT